MKNVHVLVKSQLTKSDGKLLIVDDPEIIVKEANLNVVFENLFGGDKPQFSKVSQHLPCVRDIHKDPCWHMRSTFGAEQNTQTQPIYLLSLPPGTRHL